MGKNLIINGITYNGIESMEIPTSDGGMATFIDEENAGAKLPELTNPAGAGDIAKGYEAIDAEGNVITGTVITPTSNAYTSGREFREHDGEYFYLGSTFEQDTMFRAGVALVHETPVSVFGDATAEDVAAWKTFTSAAGLKLTGTATGGGTDVEDSLVERSVVEYINDRVTSIGPEAFAECSELESVSFPLAETVFGFAFYACTALKNVDIPMVTSIRGSAFSESSLEKAAFPSVTDMDSHAFEKCASLWLVDLPSVTTFRNYPFTECTSLTAFVMRATGSAVKLRTATLLDDTPIATGTGYIYVPRSLLDSYKAASGWKNYANQFRALEDYTVDGTTTGALDESKI